MNPDVLKQRLVDKYPGGIAEDGRSYRDIPALELTRMIVNKHPNGVTNDGIPYKDFLGNASSSPFTSATQEESSFMQNIKRQFRERVDTAAEAQLRSIQGEQSLGSGTLQTIGQGAAFVGDVGLEALKVAVPKDLEELVAQTLSNIGQNKTVQGVAESYMDWREEHPEAAGNLEAVVNISGLLPVGKVGQLGVKGAAKGTSFVARKSAPVVTAPFRGVGNIAKTAESLVSGIPKADIETIINNPAAFSKAARESVNREAVLSNFRSLLDERLDDLSGLGSQYEQIRKSTNQVTLPPNWIARQLDSHGIKLQKTSTQAVDESGVLNVSPGAGKSKIKTVIDTETRRRLDPTELRTLDRFVNDWFGKDTLTANEFLNMRRDLSKLSRFDRQIGKSAELETVAKKIRGALDKDKIKDQLPGLRELDEKFAPELEQLSQIKRDVYNVDGTLKDGAANKIANAVGKGKGSLMSRLEEIDPGIGKQLEILRAVESIEKASGLQTGTYIKGAIGAGIIGAGGLSPATLVGMFLAFPDTAVPMMRGLGYSKKAMRAVGDAMVYAVSKLQ